MERIRDIFHKYITSSGDVDISYDVLGNTLPWMLRFLQLYKFTCTKVISAGNFAFWLIILLLQLIHCLKTSTLECWIQYGPMLLASFFAIGQQVIVVLAFSRFKIIQQNVITQISWDLNTMSPFIKRTIQRMGKIGDRWLFVILLLVTSILNLIRRDLESHFADSFIFFDIIGRHLPLLLSPSVWFLRSSFLMLAITIIIAPLYVVYCVTLIDIQVIILRGHIENLGKARTNDNNYFIKKAMKSIIQKHVEIFWLDRMMSGIMYTTKLSLAVAPLPIIIFGVQLLFSNLFSRVTSTWTVLALFLIIAFYLRRGQQMEDLMEQICFQLYDLEWYLWDVTNMKMFYILLLNASNELRMCSVTPTERFNNLFLMKFAQIFYAGFNLLRSYSS